MLMTGRYSLGSERDRKLKRGTPHLGQLFKENGYVTGVFGKDQPLHTIIKNADITEEQRQQEVADRHAYKYANFGADGVRDPGQDNKNFFQKGHYKMFLSPLDYSYDYHYTSTSVCCQPGGFFEHGVGVKPFDKFAVQRPYPEGSEKFPYNGDPLLCKGLAYKPFPSWMCREFTDYQTGNETVWKFPSGYVGPPYFKEPTDGPILMGNYPSSILVQEGYDGRDTEGEILPKALDFIAKHADGEVKLNFSNENIIIKTFRNHFLCIMDYDQVIVPLMHPSGSEEQQRLARLVKWLPKWTIILANCLRNLRNTILIKIPY